MIQILKKNVLDKYANAYRYYQILSAINDLKLAKGELQLVAFTAIRGNITEKVNRKDFCKKYETTAATINNVVSRLKKKNVIHKTKDNLLIVNPVLAQVKFDESMRVIVDITIVAPVDEISDELREDNILNVKKYG